MIQYNTKIENQRILFKHLMNYSTINYNAIVSMKIHFGTEYLFPNPAN